jgi:hypothetical protein
MIGICAALLAQSVAAGEVDVSLDEDRDAEEESSGLPSAALDESMVLMPHPIERKNPFRGYVEPLLDDRHAATAGMSFESLQEAYDGPFPDIHPWISEHEVVEHDT